MSERHTLTPDLPGTYRWFARCYDRLAASERAASSLGVRLLAPRHGDRLLEIGCGPGRATVELAARAGASGHVDAVDLSPQMVVLTRRRLGRAGLAPRATVHTADARRLPFPDGSFDGALTSFTLELFPDAAQAVVLTECRRVLRERGRLAVVSLTDAGPGTMMRRLYASLHRHFPRVIDCRPIDVVGALRGAGFELDDVRRMPLWGLPVEIVVATPAPATLRGQ